MLIEINGLAVTLLRKRVKNINLRIRRTGEVQISAPQRISMSIIYHFLHNKRSWIELHRQRLQLLKQHTSQNLIAGEYIHFQGKKYELHLYEIPINPHIELDDKQLHFFVKPGSSQSDKELLLRAWYHTQMQQCLPALLSKWQTLMNVQIIKVNLKHMKSRWGSCHPQKKHITLNVRLMEKPLTCLEYVIVHELVHLFEASHNQRFYALMSHYLPNWKQIKKQLALLS